MWANYSASEKLLQDRSPLQKKGSTSEKFNIKFTEDGEPVYQLPFIEGLLLYQALTKAIASSTTTLKEIVANFTGERTDGCLVRLVNLP